MNQTRSVRRRSIPIRPGVAALALVAGTAMAAPEPQVPSGTDIAGMPYRAPGTFPSRASGANWFMETPRHFGANFDRVAALGALPTGTGGNFYGLFAPQLPAAVDSIYLVDIAAGPIPFTTGELNNGDNDLNIGPSLLGEPGTPEHAMSFPLTPRGDIAGIASHLTIEDEVLDILLDGTNDSALGSGFWDAFRDTGNQGGVVPNPDTGEFIDVTIPAFNVENLSLRSGQPTYSWALDSGYGVLLGSVMNHERDNILIGVDFSTFPDFTLAQVAPTRGHISTYPDGGAGVGYNMTTGQYFGDDSTGQRLPGRPDGRLVVSTHMIEPDLSFELTVDYSTFWFPYAEGWLGGYATTLEDDPANGLSFLETLISLSDPSLGSLVNATPGLDPAVMQWDNFAQARGSIDFTRVAGGPGGTPDDGLLFMISADNPELGTNTDLIGGILSGNIIVGSYPNFIGTLPTATGWQFAIRQSDAINTNGIAPPPDLSDAGTAIQNEFGFVYLDFGTCGLIGGVVAPDGSPVAGRSTAGFKIDKLADGRYAIGIDGDGATNLTDRDGGLLLQIEGELPYDGLIAGTPEPDRAYIGYDFDPGYIFDDLSGGAFIVETFELVPTGYSVRDAGFAFAWFDFQSPIGLPKTGDINGDGVQDIFDILRFFELFGAGDPAADFTGDGTLDLFDILGFFAVFGGTPSC